MSVGVSRTRAGTPSKLPRPSAARGPGRKQAASRAERKALRGERSGRTHGGAPPPPTASLRGVEAFGWSAPAPATENSLVGSRFGPGRSLANYCREVIYPGRVRVEPGQSCEVILKH